MVIRSIIEILAILLFIYALTKEKQIIDFEDALFKKIKRKIRKTLNTLMSL